MFQRFLLTFWSCVVIWMFFQMQASGFEDTLLETDSSVLIENTSELIRFIPAGLLNTNRTTTSPTIVFYPGALVQAEAYAPFARALAENGYSVIIQKIPFRIAFTEGMEQKVFEKTLEIISKEKTNEKWVLAGHSKGGAMAANFSDLYSEKLSALLLIGTSHPRRVDLTSLAIPITKVYASEDGLASVEEVEDFGQNLPPHTSYVLVEGGNHSQFGWYGIQLGSGTPQISREEQQKQLLAASLDLIQQIN